MMFLSDGGSSTDGSTARSDSPAPSTHFTSQEETEKPPDPELEKKLLGYLSDLSLSLPTDSLTITNELNSVSLCIYIRYLVEFCFHHLSCINLIFSYFFDSLSV